MNQSPRLPLLRRNPSKVPPIGWKCNDEKLRMLIALTDRDVERLCNRAGQAFFRAFIVENRETGHLMARFRFRYTTGDSWYDVEPKKQDGAIEFLRNALTDMILTTSAILVIPIKENDLHYYSPPDDQGNPDHTVAWLLEHDLVELVEIKL